MKQFRRTTKWQASTVAGVVLGLLLGFAGIADASSGLDKESGEVNCERHTVPVSLTPGGAKSLSVSGVLCAAPADLRDGSTIQLLVPGATYNHSYWDFGEVNGTDYSYARGVAASGIPTFAIDPLGTGESSRPPSADLTIEKAGDAVHQVVQALLGTSDSSGNPEWPRFGEVILVGHSLGSMTVWAEAIKYRDISGLIITGMVHHVSDKRSKEFGTSLYPAVLDPQFAGKITDPGYWTTKPGTRGNAFFDVPHSDPSVIAKDEATKDVFSVAQLDGFFLNINDATRAINVPTMIIMGSDDFLCPLGPLGDTPGALGSFDCSSGSAIASQEAPIYGPGAQVEACSVADSGHDITLSAGHALQEAASVAWSMRVIGQRGVRTETPLPTGCG
jgi:pimeloyl-ACP methyl ester carboxylesterase